MDNRTAIELARKEVEKTRIVREEKSLLYTQAEALFKTRAMCLADFEAAKNAYRAAVIEDEEAQIKLDDLLEECGS